MIQVDDIVFIKQSNKSWRVAEIHQGGLVILVRQGYDSKLVKRSDILGTVQQAAVHSNWQALGV